MNILNTLKKEFADFGTTEITRTMRISSKEIPIDSTNREGLLESITRYKLLGLRLSNG